MYYLLFHRFSREIKIKGKWIEESKHDMTPGSDAVPIRQNKVTKQVISKTAMMIVKI